MKRTAEIAIVGAAMLTLLAATVRPAPAFDLTGHWAAKKNLGKCKGFQSDTGTPEMVKIKFTTGIVGDVEITHSGGKLDILLDRGLTILPADRFHGFAYDLKKRNGTVDANKALGAFVACGGIPESLESNYTRSELGRIERAKLSRSGKAKMKFVVEFAHLGDLPGPFGNGLYTCTYDLKRVSTDDPLVPSCP